MFSRTVCMSASKRSSEIVMSSPFRRPKVAQKSHRWGFGPVSQHCAGSLELGLDVLHGSSPTRRGRDRDDGLAVGRVALEVATSLGWRNSPALLSELDHDLADLLA